MHPIRIIQDDPHLANYEHHIRNRIDWYDQTINYINQNYGSLEQFASAHLYFGFNYDEDKKGWWFREWLPNAKAVYLIGDFNQWNHSSHPLKKVKFGAWEIFLSDESYQNLLTPFSKIKLLIDGNNGKLARIPPYINRLTQNPDHSFDGQFIGKSNFNWTDSNFNFNPQQPPMIYEAHIGMAQEAEKVGTYKEFTQNILPRIKKLGYNCIQLMAVQEHPYYGSFGYQVSSFFAPTSRFGTPDELRELINTAHQMDIGVILDVVHSHAVKNQSEGLALIDGTEQYFSGWHPDWDSRLFDYGKLEVKRFLLSNIKYWLDEFHFDGFRFDGVTSMLYHHFGHVSFTNYDAYFNHVNHDAVLYLQMANQLIKKIRPNSISICEDMSGMPGACRTIEDGGLGFDYRLNMGIPDFWMTTLEQKRDEDWHMGDMFWRLSSRRDLEKNIGYAESHDQALVGDKTIAFWLMDKDMYTGMSVFTQNLNIDRGIALHKLIRFVSICLSGEGYMNFMGNEFGHPEWVDFPREGNHWSYAYARRQWSLADTEHLKYKYLQAFDVAMLAFVKQHQILQTPEVYLVWEDNQNNIMIFKKNNLIFAFNFSANSSPHYQWNTNDNNEYKIIFDSDSEAFGGFSRLDHQVHFLSTLNHQNQWVTTGYLPSRTAVVLQQVD